jgi:two-component sensor histidine kinase
VQHALQSPRGGTDLDAAEYLRQLCENRRATLENADVRFVGCSVSLDAARCRRLGMIVSELVENARKHAFCGAHGPTPGSISVELSALDGEIRCRVCDNGRGYSGAIRGRGLTIVCALAKSLDGRISQEPATGGTAWLLTIPH